MQNNVVVMTSARVTRPDPGPDPGPSSPKPCPVVPRCNPGRVGRQCECSSNEVATEDMDRTCRRDNTTDLCSNNGECVCGTCECKKRDNADERYSGPYCECDNFNCDRSNNLLCGGGLVCVCVCVCVDLDFCLCVCLWT